MPDDEMGRAPGADWPDVVIPDDLRDLQGDIDAYHRELRAARRRRRRERLPGPLTGGRWALPAALLSAAMALSVLAAMLITATPAHGLHALAPAPIASRPAVPDGVLHGRLPDVPLLGSDGSTTSARALRPALLALVPIGCRCTDLLERLASQADAAGLPLVVVAPASVDAEVSALPGRLHHGRVTVAFDPTAALASVYAASGLTAVVVTPDATVSYVATDVTSDVRLDPQLEDMTLVRMSSR